jgi:hypothetical protein
MRRFDILPLINKQNIEWLVGLIRPKWHNKITWSAFLVGVGLSAAPVWEPYLRALARKYLDLTIDPPETTVWGIGLIISALAYSAFLAKIESGERSKTQQEIVAHDCELAQKLRSILPEGKLNQFRDRMYGNHAYRQSEIEPVDAALDFLNSAETHFLDMEVAGKVQAFRTMLRQIVNFTHEHFDQFPYNQRGDNYQCAMHPHWNIDRGAPTEDQMRKYNELTKELNGLLFALRDRHRELVQAFHTRLHC